MVVGPWMGLSQSPQWLWCALLFSGTSSDTGCFALERGERGECGVLTADIGLWALDGDFLINPKGPSGGQNGTISVRKGKKLEFSSSFLSFSLFFFFSKFWTNTLGKIFTDVCVMKPIVRRILGIFKARMPLKLKASRKAFPLGKISWALCNNSEANFSKCLLILITPHRFLPLGQSEVAHSGQQ